MSESGEHPKRKLHDDEGPAGLQPDQCPVCFQTYARHPESLRPRVFACGHTLCTGCIQGMLETAKVVRCVFCRVLATHCMEKVPINHNLLAMIDAPPKRRKFQDLYEKSPEEKKTVELDSLSPAELAQHGSNMLRDITEITYAAMTSHQFRSDVQPATLNVRDVLSRLHFQLKACNGEVGHGADLVVHFLVSLCFKMGTCFPLSRMALDMLIIMAQHESHARMMMELSVMEYLRLALKDVELRAAVPISQWMHQLPIHEVTLASMLMRWESPQQQKAWISLLLTVLSRCSLAQSICSPILKSLVYLTQDAENTHVHAHIMQFSIVSFLDTILHFGKEDSKSYAVQLLKNLAQDDKLRAMIDKRNPSALIKQICSITAS